MNTTQLLDLILTFSKKKGCTFIRIADYRNAEGELSDVTVNIGISMANAKAKDIETLEAMNVRDLFKEREDVTFDLLETARQELLSALKAPNKAMSEAQIDAYSHICKGVKVHNETNELHIYGFKIDGTKAIKEKGDYKADTRKPLTKAKDLIRKGLKSPHYRQYKLSALGSVKFKGNTITLTQESEVLS
ncbi:hypothetical protein E6Q11_05240 [Candidatus Dojkabacteria bacterium]|uniref:Uncharacterized protein n=1 Tax=Candidatus Dojkabacteria bacterium TaxID=2099670 RepID=A0A5C7J3Y9_9BACT|nr:MAG: hypothetical protein E6Q11_05240 [Candidatus Dojkabacteria bacterium]